MRCARICRKATSRSASHVDVRHLAPTPVGRRVVAKARVMEKTRSSVLFEVQAFDGERLIGEGRHRRGVVDGRGFGG